MNKPLQADLHIHSSHSIDARNTIDEMCLSAFNSGYHTICFTEHFDSNPNEEGYRFLNFERYAEDIERAREAWDGKLTILKGIEFGEPHLYQKDFENILTMDFDFVLGSVHNIGTTGIFGMAQRKAEEKVDITSFFEQYYREVLKAVEFGGFDSLAHMDYPKRYFPEYYEPQDILDEIGTALVRQNIALELNSKPIGLGFSELNPSNNICSIYAKHGGVKVTPGSDAHQTKYIGENFESISRVIDEFGFQPVGFSKRLEFSLV
jgi:histidinol-phosphatase (PHP family)